MNVLIPGSTGFLGRNIVSKLKEEGITYTPVFSTETDFRDIDQVKKIFRENSITHIVNCAAFVGGIQFGEERAGEIYYNNTLISTNLFECARLFNIQRVINPISNCSYPAHLTRGFKEEEWWEGALHDSVLVYGFVRKASWIQSIAYKKQYNLDTINLLIPNMYGPYDHFEEKRSHALGALIMKFIKAKNNNEKEVIVWGSGKPIREWLYVKDAVKILIESLKIKPITDPINIGCDKGISIKDLAYLIAKIVGYKGSITFDKTKLDGAPYKTMDSTKMKSIFNSVPNTDLQTGIEETVNWYINNKL